MQHYRKEIDIIDLWNIFLCVCVCYGTDILVLLIHMHIYTDAAAKKTDKLQNCE